MKILLFTDLPPSEASSGGLLLQQVAGRLPPDVMVCFAAIDPDLDIQHPARTGRMAAYLIDATVRRRSILQQAEAFGRRHGADVVLAFLRTQPTIDLALPLARALKAPLYILVDDPPTPDAGLEAAIKHSQAVATSSYALTTTYAERYGVRAQTLLLSHPAHIARLPEPVLNQSGELIIGMAGLMHQQEAYQLIRALDACGWTLRDRSVSLRHFGDGMPDLSAPAGKLELNGRLDAAVLVDALSRCDLLYINGSFAADAPRDAHLGLPAQMAIYLAAGRPVIVHGPTDSAAALYVRDRAAGLCAAAVQASSIFNALDTLARNPQAYRAAALAAQAAFQADFTEKTFDAGLRTFLGSAQIAESAAASEPAPVIDKRRWRGAASNRWLKAPRPLRRWVRELTAAQFSPAQIRLDLATAWAYRRAPVTSPAGTALSAFSVGTAPWDYVAALSLPEQSSGRYLSLDVTSLDQEIYVLLVDKDWNGVGERVVVPPRRGWFNVWLDLDKAPGARLVVFQCNGAPNATEVWVHRMSIRTSWSRLLRSGKA